MSKLLIAALAGMVAVFLYDYGGEIEGRLFPVMGPLQLYDGHAFPPPEYRTRWKGEALKRRGCDFLRVEWFLGPRNGRRVRVQVEFTDPPQVRGTGRLHWHGLVISLDAAEVLGNSHADVIHQCPWRPWRTRSQFFN